MLIYYPQIEEDLTIALQLSNRLQQEMVIPLVETLEDRMLYLSMYANHDRIDNTICLLGNDFADFSFSFAIYFRNKEATLSLVDIERLIDENNGYKYPDPLHKIVEYAYSYRINGGLIYHGNVGRTKNNFTVSLSPTSGWSIHT